MGQASEEGVLLEHTMQYCMSGYLFVLADDIGRFCFPKTKANKLVKVVLE